MTEIIEVNGAKMDKDYFNENVQEAKQLTWKEVKMNSLKDHTHCIICTIAMPNNQSETAFQSNSLTLCSFCHSSYLKDQSVTC